MATQLRKSYEQRFGVQEGWLKLYDAKGNLIYCEDRKDGWEKFEYDNKGNEIYLEDSNGCWEKSEYDDKGNVIYYESPGDFWVKYEYDEEGNEIYRESSSSGITLDKRNNLEGKIVTIDGKEYKLTGIR